jgi:hypothetical protein
VFPVPFSRKQSSKGARELSSEQGMALLKAVRAGDSELSSEQGMALLQAVRAGDRNVVLTQLQSAPPPIPVRNPVLLP